MIEIFNQIYKKSANAANLLPEYILEMRDCAMISLNITSELITHPIDVSYKMSFEEKKQEYNVRHIISTVSDIFRLFMIIAYKLFPQETLYYDFSNST